MRSGECRFCRARLVHTFVDLGVSPLSNAFLDSAALHRMEPFYPLHAYLCSSCFLVQLEAFESPKTIFSNYPYFSSYSETWLKHAEEYVDAMIARFDFNKKSHVIEIASNDGYLLQYFRKKEIPTLGIEPAANVAQIARERGIQTVVEFFGLETARRLATEGMRADLLLGNNVLAHVPDLNDFVGGMKVLLKSGGVITMEFPHLFRLINENQFDTIYHEHLSYFSLTVVEKIFAEHGLMLFDVEELPTHGGSLRIYAKHEEERVSVAQSIGALKEREKRADLDRLEGYASFQRKVLETKCKLLTFLIEAKRKGKSIAGYGAPAKGNTLLNYCGIGKDFIDYTVDRSPHKQECFLPGTRIPIYHPNKVKETKPDYLLILPWNLKAEIMQQMTDLRSWGGKFVIPLPGVEVID